VALAGMGERGIALILLLALGAWAMRSAGCVYNDLVDRDLDRQIERTRLRPLASGRVTPIGAWVLIAGLCLVGLAVLLQLPRVAQIIALASLAPVAFYPFAKRVTWWPQLWLGIVFSWAALVGWAAVEESVGLAGVLLYAGSITWVIGYDTIYALQDRDDDALVGVRSSARALGRHARVGVALFYLAALCLWAGAIWQRRPDWLGLLALAPMALHLAWQVATLRIDDGEDALAKFRSNRFAGMLMFLACLVVGTTSS
jgi:4-hydroxybenzoate polyprenyltransferase